MASPFSNLGVKLAAVLLATLLWFHVATDKVIQYKIRLPLNQIDLSEDLVLAEPPESEVDVMVSATGKRLLQTDWKKEGLKLTVSRNIAGRFKAELNLNTVSMVKSDGVDLAEILSPREITLNCDRLMEVEVPVKSNIKITTDDGFVLNRVNTIMPQKVTVSGPRRNVLAIDSIETRAESYPGIRNDLKLKVPLIYPDYYGIKIKPDTVNYFIGVAPIKSREFENVPVKVLNFPSDSLDMLKAPSVSLRIGGEAEYVDTIVEEDLIAVADYNHIDADGNIAIKITLPKQVKLLNQTPKTVNASALK